MFASGCVVLGSAFVWSVALGAQQPVSDGPQYAGGNTLVKPANYREWTFLASGLGMTYDASAAGTTFTNVFVNPAAYRGFMSTGRWPDKSVFVLRVPGFGDRCSAEHQRALSNASHRHRSRGEGRAIS
jgi:hypothetical protein